MIPYQHQQDAIKAILKEFETENRCQVQMACGTGKTNTCIWVAEKLDVRNIVIFVPTLLLINQFLKEWKQTYKNHYYISLVVCCDQTINISNFDFKISIDKNEIYDFLNKKTKDRKIVFCTYSSGPLLCDSIPKNFFFDLGIFDEAHRTSGISKGERDYSCALYQHNINIAKRLFMTATPVNKTIRRKDVEKEYKIYSMDNTELYGKCVYALSFEKAIKLGLICDYKVIIGVYKEKKGENPLIDKLIAFEKAALKSGCRKVISYHKNIYNAKRFIVDLLKEKKLTHFKKLHVNGEFSLRQREIIFKEFLKHEYSLMTNSKCLTEGIDIPNVDMVSFIDVKYSHIEIIQAIGRCIRKNEGKDIGYIFVPLFLNNKNEVDENSKDFKHLIEVLHQVKTFTYSIDSDVQNFGSRNNSFNYKVNLEHDIEGLDLTILNKIKAQILDELVDDWEIMFLKAKEFYKENKGNIYIKKFEDQKLKVWIQDQRHYYKIGILSPLKYERLQSIGLVFNLHESIFNENFNKLLEYKNKYGDNFIKYIKEKSLQNFINSQRKYFKKGTLAEYRVKAFQNVGIDLNQRFEKDSWDDMLESIKKLIQKHGIDNYKKYMDKKMINWQQKQRHAFKHNKLNKFKILQLQNAKIDLKASYSDFLKMCNKLEACYNRNDISMDRKAHEELAKFLLEQRKAYNDKSLPEWKLKLLNGANRKWYTRDIDFYFKKTKKTVNA